MNDRFTERAVVLFLGVIAVLGLVELGWLVATTDIRDAALISIIVGPTTGAIGVLGGLLARVGAGEVKVVNEPQEPIPTADVVPPKKR